MQKIHGVLNYTVLISQLGHVFCCGVPALVSVLSLVIGFGLIGSVPGILGDLHQSVHIWEKSILIFSGSMLTFGWALDNFSRHMVHEKQGCSHKSCHTKKQKNSRILIFSSVLFAINIFLYLYAHGMMA